MIRSRLSRIRRVGGLGLLTILAAWVVWAQTPGMSVVHAPQASGTIKEAGLTLFEHEWKPGDPLANGDGLGPVFNERSCVACHFQGGVGGAGDTNENVTAFEIHPVPGRPQVLDGMIHRFALSKDCRESRTGLNDFFAVVPGGVKVVGTCFVETRDFDPVRTQSINPTALYGAGWIDRIPAKTILHEHRKKALQAIGKEILADLEGIKPGRARVLADGRIGKFGWKAQFATLEEFVASACSNELGLGTPLMEQAKPYAHQAETTVDRDLDAKQFRSLVSFVDTLPRPTEILPADPKERGHVERGKIVFEKIGCASCHTPEIGGVAGIYSDFMLHRISSGNDLGGGYAEVPQVQLPDDHPLPDEWKTPPLWGVADSAPYFHDGAAATLELAISRHRGDATNVIKAFEVLSGDDQTALVSFLKSLKAPVGAKPAGPRPRAMIASR